jgi:hypothetical protein
VRPRQRSAAARTAAAGLALALAACGQGGDAGAGGVTTPPPQPPAVDAVRIAVVAGVPGLDTLLVGDAAELRAEALDAAGAPVAARVVWTSSAPAVAGVVGLGAPATLAAQGPGEGVVTATAGGRSASVRVRVEADLPVALTVAGQTALAPDGVAVLEVAATGRRGNALPPSGLAVTSGAPERVAVGAIAPVAAPGPTAAPTDGATGASSSAVAVTLRAGRVPGATTVRATVPGPRGPVEAAVAVAVVAPSLTVDVREVTPLPPAVRRLLAHAVTRFQAAFAAYPGPTALGSTGGRPLCGPGTPAGAPGGAPDSVAGLRLYVRVVDDLGVAGAAATGGPCVMREGRTVVGRIYLLPATAAYDSVHLYPLLLHELAHVFGFGLWPAPTTADVPGPDPRFLGARALAAYRAAGVLAAAAVPLETEGVSAYAHWRARALGREVMAGGAIGPVLSAVTLGALADLGYDVRPAAADVYRVPRGSASAAAFGAPAPAPRRGAAVRPDAGDVDDIEPVQWVVTRSGALRPVDAHHAPEKGPEPTVRSKMIDVRHPNAPPPDTED